MELKKNAVCMKVEVLTRKIGFKFGNFCWQKIRTSETAAKTQKKKRLKNEAQCDILIHKELKLPHWCFYNEVIF